MRKYSALVFLGSINVLHAFTHLFQVIQSAFFISYATSEKENWVHTLMESKWMALFWGILGIITIILGIRDYKHHKHHKD